MSVLAEADCESGNEKGPVIRHNGAFCFSSVVMRRDLLDSPSESQSLSSAFPT